MCRGCGRQRLSECTCGLADKMRKELAGLVTQGKNREQVYQYFIDQWGSQEPLASPIDKGFNRLAWAVPYAVGLLGLGDRDCGRRPLVALRTAGPGRRGARQVDRSRPRAASLR